MTHKERALRRDRVIHRVEGGEVIGDIAKDEGLSESYVYMVAHRSGVQFFGVGSRQRETREAIAAAVRAGSTIEAEASKHGVSLGTARAACRERGVPVPDLRKIKMFRAYAVIADLCNTDLTTRQIAKARGISHQRVSQIFIESKKAGIPVRPRSVGGRRNA